MPKINHKALLAIMVCLFFFMVAMRSGDRETTANVKEVPYTELMKSVKKGNVVSADVPRTGEGTIVATMRDGTKVKTETASDLWMISEMMNNDVSVTPKAPPKQSMLFSLLLSFGIFREPTADQVIQRGVLSPRTPQRGLDDAFFKTDRDFFGHQFLAICSVSQEVPTSRAHAHGEHRNEKAKPPRPLVLRRRHRSSC